MLLSKNLCFRIGIQNASFAAAVTAVAVISSVSDTISNITVLNNGCMICIVIEISKGYSIGSIYRGESRLLFGTAAVVL